MSHRIRNVVIWISLISISGCADRPVSPSDPASARLDRQPRVGVPATVVISPGTDLVLRQGWTQQLQATVLDAAGNVIPDVPIEWKAKNRNAAEVSPTGLVTAGSAGVTEILAQTSGRQPIRGSAFVVAVDDRSPLSSGTNHTCALSESKLVYCWGGDDSGQLGTGSGIWSPRPVATSGAMQFVSVAVGARASCGLTSAGKAYCWGGLPGNGSLGRVLIPTPVSGDHSFTTVFVNHERSCGLASGGQAYCWGYNFSGRLGTGDQADASVPVAVIQGDLKFQSLALGGEHTCGLTADGSAYCWGSNLYGQLGTGSNQPMLTPSARIASPPGARFVALTAGQHHTCALSTYGIGYCWGWNPYGQVGNDLGDSRTPLPVTGGLRFTQLSAQYVHTCGLTSTGEVFCWGYNVDGQVGDGSIGEAQRRQPTRVQSNRRFGYVAAGSNHTCAMANNGRPSCWGRHAEGQLGNGVIGFEPSPVSVNGSARFHTLSGGSEHACGLTAVGQASCWGANFGGRLGNGSASEYSLSPSAVIQSTPFAAISAGSAHTCALTSSGLAYCWGENGNLQLGRTGRADIPDLVAGGFSFVSIASGAYHACGLTSSGQASCWGANFRSQIGDGSTTNRSVPTAVNQSGLTYNRLSIGAGGQHTCALTASGAAYCWGFNLEGQLGDNSNTDRASPVAVVQGALAFVEIAAGSAHTCALTPGGDVYCWGSNSRGQVGSGYSGGQIYQPTRVAGAPRFARLPLRMGAEHSCAFDTAGATYCWGRNVEGQLGLGASNWSLPGGSPTDSPTPARIPNAPRFSSMEPGGYFSCGLSATGRASCWGSDVLHQIGAGTAFLRPTSVLPF